MNTLRKSFIFLFLALAASGFAQSASISLTTDQSIVGSNEKMISLLVALENTTTATESLELSFSADKDLRILTNSTAINLAPKAKLFLPFKAYVERGQPAGKSLIHFTLRDTNSNIVAKSTTQLVIEPKRQLRIIANTPQVLMERVGDSLLISTQIYNGGNAEETIQLFATFPQNYGGEITLKKSMTLPPFTNKEVTFSKIIDRNLLKLEVFTVNIAGTDLNNAYFGNTMILVQNAAGSRKYVDPLNQPRSSSNSPNHISWRTNNPFSEFSSSHNIDVHSEANIGNTNTSFNLNGTYWQGSDLPLLLQNTWLRIERRKSELQLGNISTNDLEVSTSGRGATFSYQPGNEKKTSITAGFVEKSYSLFDPFHWNTSARGSTSFTRATIRLDDHKELDHQLIFDTDPFQRSWILKNGYTYNNKKNTFYNFDFGYGYTTSATDSNLHKPSAALGFNYRKNWQQFTLNSSNYYSTGYYPGIKKGSILMEENLSRSFKNFSLYANYSLNIYNPSDINPLYQYHSYSRRNKVELGSILTIGKGLTATVTSQYVKEHAEIFTGDYLRPEPIDFRSVALTASINYNTLDNKNRFTLTQASGVSHYYDRTRPGYLYQIQAGWSRSDFMISTNYQRGNLMIYDGNANGIITNDTERLSAIFNYRISLLEKRLQLNFSAIGNSDSRYGKNLSFGTNLDFQVLRTTKVFANFNYNKYASKTFNTSNLYTQIGITQDLPTFGDATTAYQSGMVKVFAFYDLNNNSTYDAEFDQPASGTKITINNTVFISDERGNIKYRKVPYGPYTVKSLDNKWYSEEQEITLDKKEKFLTVALAKTSIVRGGIQYQKATNTQYNVPKILAGIPVQFTNQFNKIFTFYTDDQGQFMAYVPVGRYRISIIDTALPNKIYVDDHERTVVVVADLHQKIDDFILKIREKKVEVKKFGKVE